MMLSPSLRLQVTMHVFHSTIQKMPCFDEYPEVVDFIVRNIETQQYMTEEYIIKQDSKATHMYFLAQGQCEVLIRDQTRKEKLVRDLHEGMMFGEVAIVHNTKRTASVKSKEHCTVGAISIEFYQELVRDYPEMEGRLKLETVLYRDHWKLF